MAPAKQYKPLSVISMRRVDGHESQPAVNRPTPALKVPVPPISNTASTAYNLVHIQPQIFSHLSDSTLAVLMRTDKGIMEEVAVFLYREATWKRVQKCTNGSAFQQIFLKSVKIIHAFCIEMSFHQLKALAPMCPNVMEQGYDPEFFREYRPELVIPLVTPLKVACPKLKEVRFGEEHRGYTQTSWNVHFRHTRSTGRVVSLGKGTTGLTPSYTLHIEHIESVQFYLFAPPFEDMEEPPKLPPGGHTQSCRFDLDLDTWHNGVELVYQPNEYNRYDPDAWRKALQDVSHFKDIYRYIDFGQLPIPLDEITHLISRQIEAGHTQQLAYIRAAHYRPFDIDSWTSFAQIASTSLVSLRLAQRYVDHPDMVSFDDLPTIISSIQKYLPNLDTLHIAIRNVDIAESVSWRMLSTSTVNLNRRGSLQVLRIHTQPSHTDLFNTIRCLSGLMCGAPYSPVLHIGPSAGEVFKWNSEAQKRFLLYIRRQSPSRQYRLSKVDFATLDINTANEACELAYDKHGEPQHRWKTQAAVLAEKALGEKSSCVFIPAYHRGPLRVIHSTNGSNYAYGNIVGVVDAGGEDFGGW